MCSYQGLRLQRSVSLTHLCFQRMISISNGLRKNAVNIIIGIATIVFLIAGGVFLKGLFPVETPLKRGQEKSIQSPSISVNSQTSPSPITNLSIDRTSDSKVGLTEPDRAHAFKRVLQSARETVIRRKWIALAIGIFLVLAIAGAITGTLLYQKHAEQLHFDEEEAKKLRALEEAPQDVHIQIQSVNEPPQTGMSVGSIVAIVISVLVVVAIIVGCLCYYFIIIREREKHGTLRRILSELDKDKT